MFSLGLAVRHGPATALVPLTGHKDRELVLLADRADRPELVELMQAALQLYTELGVFCHSMGAMLPTIGQRSEVNNMKLLGKP